MIMFKYIFALMLLTVMLVFPVMLGMDLVKNPKLKKFMYSAILWTVLLDIFIGLNS